MGFRSWNLTDVGLRREVNEDSVLVDESLGLFIVADGMGGHKGGEIASSMAVQTVQYIISEQMKSRLLSSPRDLILASYMAASSRIFERSLSQGESLRGMGTTMVMGLVTGSKLYVGNVGDSRAYLFRRPHLWQITEDHSLINEQIRAGILPEDVPRNFLGRNVITRSVGYEREVHVDVVEREVSRGEMYLFCSDGLSGLVSDYEIADLLSRTSPDKVVKAAVDMAKTRGGDDNISVILVEIQ